MPQFTVTKGHDATAYFVAVIEADTKEEAEQAGWDGDGDFEFSHYQEFDDVETVEVEPYDETDVVEGLQIDVSGEERDIILAALRHWQASTNISPEIYEIAENGRGRFLSDNAINDLCERINI